MFTEHFESHFPRFATDFFKYVLAGAAVLALVQVTGLALSACLCCALQKPHGIQGRRRY